MFFVYAFLGSALLENCLCVVIPAILQASFFCDTVCDVCMSGKIKYKKIVKRAQYGVQCVRENPRFRLHYEFIPVP
jgi:hypothetical protein